MYLLTTIIGSPVSMFRANDTKLRRCVTVFELFSLMSFIGSAISTDHVSSLFFWKKTILQLCLYNVSFAKMKYWRYCYDGFFFKYCILTPSFVISILLLLIPVVCSCCNFAVKGVTCFELVAVGTHIPACKKESLTDLFEIISNFIFRKGKQIGLKFCLIKIRRIFNVIVHTDSTLQNSSKQTTTSES